MKLDESHFKIILVCSSEKVLDVKQKRNVTQFGPVEVHVVSQIVCIFSCGLHGYRMPKIAESGQVSCTCECDLGWETDMDQSFDFFEYCAVQHETQSVPGPEGPLDSTLESTGM